MPIWYNSSMEERRNYKRYTIAYPVEGTPVEHNREESLLDVSKSGIAFLGSKDVLKDDIIDVRLFLKSKMFRLKAVVVYINPLKNGEIVIGARFLEHSKAFKDAFDREIDEIKTLYRDLNLHKKRTASFKNVSREYLEALNLS